MARDLVISVGPGEIRAGVFEDGRAVDLRIERDERESLVGAVFLGRVVRLVPALPGAFVELGTDRPAFLPGARSLTEGAAVIVQIAKDAFDDKAPEVTTMLELPGDYVAWTPHRPGVSVSRQIPAAKRALLSALAEPLIREGEGAVLRSTAMAATARDIEAEIDDLRRRYADLRRAARTAEPPARLDEAEGPLDRLVSTLGRAAARILIDDRAGFARLRRDKAGGLGRSELVGPGAEPIEALDRAIDQALAPLVALPDGGRLWIETGTAFTAADVDLGSGSGRRAAEDEIRRVNLTAAEALGCELRLRNIGGAVVVDFISMASRRHRQDVEAVLAAAVADDPAGIELHGWTRLGHFELTRRRTCPSLADVMLEPLGSTRAKSAATVGFEVLRAFTRAPFAAGGLAVRVHPSIEGLLRGRLSRHLAAAQDRAGQKLQLRSDPSRAPDVFDLGPA
jgi:Rne/Rng family ribonuclease